MGRFASFSEENGVFYRNVLLMFFYKMREKDELLCPILHAYTLVLSRQLLNVHSRGIPEVASQLHFRNHFYVKPFRT